MAKLQWRNMYQRLSRGSGPERQASARRYKLPIQEPLDRMHVQNELGRAALVLVQHVGRKIPPLEIGVAETVGADADPDPVSFRVPALGVWRRAHGTTASTIQKTAQLFAEGVVPG